MTHPTVTHDPASEPAYWIWATRHTGHIFDDDPDDTGTLHQEVDDEDFARMRLDWWLTNRPDVTSTLLRRPVYFGEWQEVSADHIRTDRHEEMR